MVQSALPKPGDIVGGKYRIEAVLGRGGMGVVFEASHCVTEKRFAIKWLLSEPAQSGDSVTRFVREAQVAGRCQHRNIVEVYDIDRQDSTLFMVMELLKGESLSERIERNGPLPYAEACQLLLPCIEAIGEAHGAGIIHRDLKPANIFVCRARGREAEFAKILDFGVSRFAVTADAPTVARTRSGAIVGTPFYMAPEQLRGQAIDARVDVYSMGVTLYEVLAGARPYNANSYGDLLFRIAQGSPPSLSHTVADLPVRLSAIVQRAMAMDRDARFASMDELARAIEPFVRHTSSSSSVAFPSKVDSGAAPSGNTPWVAEAGLSAGSELDERRAGRRSMWIALAVVALALSALMALVLWRGAERAEPSIRSGGPFRPEQSPPSAAGSAEMQGAAPALATDAQSPELQGEASQPRAQDAGVPMRFTPAALPGRAGRRHRSSQLESSAASTTDGAEDGKGSSKRRPGEPKAPTRSRAPATMNRSDF